MESLSGPTTVHLTLRFKDKNLIGKHIGAVRILLCYDNARSSVCSNKKHNGFTQTDCILGQRLNENKISVQILKHGYLFTNYLLHGSQLASIHKSGGCVADRRPPPA